MNADEARSVLTEMHRDCKSLSSRRNIVSAALRISNLDSGAANVYRAYFAAISADA